MWYKILSLEERIVLDAAAGDAVVSAAAGDDGPVAVDEAFEIGLDQSLTGSINDLLANDSDPNGDSLSGEVLSGPTAHGNAEYDPDTQMFSYTPDQGYSGMDSFEYSISDGTQSALGTVTIQVNNQPPIAGDDAITTLEDEPVIQYYLLQNDSDPDGDSLSLTPASGQSAHGTYYITANGFVNYFPDLNFNGTDSFNYEVVDGKGGSDIGTVTITITPVNDAPIANDDHLETLENQVLNFSAQELLANDTDPEGDPLTISQVLAPPQHGELIFDQAAQLFTYTPNPDFHGTDSFVYKAYDGHFSIDASAEAAVTIEVIHLNEPPEANNDAFTIDEDTTLNANLLANDFDPDGDPLSALITVDAQHGQASLDPDGNLTYTPDLNYFGSDQLTYQISDGELTDSAIVDITINPVNDPPVAVDDQLTVGAGLAMNIDVLANDSDVDNAIDELRVEIVDGPEFGTVIVNADQTITYDHDPFRNFNDSFTYRVIDPDGASDEATVNVTIEELSEGPNIRLLGAKEVTYLENSGAKIITRALFLTDDDSPDFSGGKLGVQISENGTENDMLFIEESRHVGVDMDGNVMVKGTDVGHVEGGEMGQPLIVDFNENASAADIALVISRIAYQNDSDNPSIDLRTIEYVVTDGDGGISNAGTKTLRFLDFNDSPEIIADSDSASADAGEIIALGDQLGLNITDADLDEDGMIAVSLKVFHGRLNFSDTSGLETVIFSDQIDLDGARKIRFTASLEEANILLNNLTYEANDGFSGEDTLLVKVNDLGGDGLLGGTGNDWESFDICVS